MSNPLPSSLTLTNIADGGPIVASDHRNNYTALQIAVNALIAYLAAPGKLPYVGMPVGVSLTETETPAANRVILVPFSLPVGQTIDRVHFRAGATRSGHFDVGVYDSSGILLVSKGSTLCSTLTASAVNEVTFTPTALDPGAYFLAFTVDNTTATFLWENEPSMLSEYQLKVDTTFPLPSSLTPGTAHPTIALLLSAPVT